MLSLSSPAPKTLGEEDSSGSDAGSDVGLEPETDRFGFIVTNGSTVGSVGPPPELVRQREAKWINIIGHWDRMLLKKTSKVKVQCQKGIPASLRAKCWPLLCGATDRMKQNTDLYTTLDSQPALQNWVDVIERDLDRQFPFHEMFLSKDGHGQRGLFRVLKAYTQYQPEEGYCQAQGPVAAVLLMNMPAEEAFWCLVQISEQYLPGYYSPLLEGVLFDAAMLTWVLKRTCPAAHKHLQHHGVEPLMFATDWLMCLFTRHLPFNTLLRVWDLFFCYGVRVLLQVAVVLVRRVLGRGDQRKQCQGQMETLERLRGVREQVQDEDDSFIAEVCSVPLSAKDLEKHTEKELEKWRKDRPSSIFDPRGRCQGYRMAWAKARQREEERERGEREKGNLSVPLVRSASTLSLSPSILHKRWRKGGKVNTAGEWEGGGGKVVRHLSMGAKEDWRSWTEVNLKKVQGFEEEDDIISEEYKKQSEPKLKGQPEHKESKEMDKIQKVSTEPVKETVPVKDETETIITEEEESQLSETEDNKVLSEQTEETNVVTEPTNEQTAENVLLTSDHKQGGEPDLSPHQEHQSPKSEDQEFEIKDTNEETEKQSEEKSAVVEGNRTEVQEEAEAETNTEVETEESAGASEEQVIQSDTKAGESAENENEQQVDVVAEASATETGPGSEADSEVEAPPVKDPATETKTQRQQEEEAEEEEEEVITETENSSEGDVFKEKYHSAESLTETDMKDESHIQTETETDVQVQTRDMTEENTATQEESESEIPQTASEQHVDSETEDETLILCSSECFQPKEGADMTGGEETEAEIPVSNSEVASPVSSEERCDAAEASEPPRQEDTTVTAQPEAEGETRAQETPPGTQKHEETPAPATPLQEEVTSTQGGEMDLTAEPDGKTGSEEMKPSSHQAGSEEMMSATEEPAPERSKVQGAVEVEENVQERSVGEDEVFISDVAANSNADSNQRVQDKDCNSLKDQTEANNSSLTQASSRRSSRSSGDFRVRKSSSSRGSGSVRRLSEDLFTVPVKISQTQSIPDQQEVKQTESKSNPGGVNQTHPLPDMTRAAEVTSLPEEATEKTQQEPPGPPKRFGLFRRLRGEQPKKAKAKMQVPKILIQDFSDDTGMEKPGEVEGEEKLSSRERRRRRREQERREKEEERLKKKREKELEKERERERRKPQTRGKSFQAQREKAGGDGPQTAKTRTLRYSASYDESYF